MAESNNKPAHGGARPGSGRKPKPYKTVTVSVRVHEDDEATVRKLVEPYKVGERKSS